jgi:MATE family multidrug resistance protein
MNDRNETQVSPKRLLSWREHLAATLKLGLPLIGAQVAQVMIGTTDTLMIGWLGAQELAASVLATTTWFLVLMFGGGFAYAVMPIAAQEKAKGEVRQVRRSVRMGLWITTIYSVAMMPVLWNIAPLLRLAGQEAELARMAQDYMRIMQFSIFPALWIMVLRSFLSALERPGAVLWSTVLALVLNAFLNYALIFGNYGAPRLELQGAAIASVVSTLASFAAIAAWSAMRAELRAYEVFVRFWVADWHAMREVFRLGWPISLTVIAEVGMFAASSLMMGWIGTIELAAHGIALQLASLVFMVPLGLSSAATVRVGQAYALSDRANMMRATWAATMLAGGVAVTSATVFLTVPEPLIRLFLEEGDSDAAAVTAFAVSFLAVAAAFQLVDMGQVIAAAALRGLRDTLVPARLAIFSYWLAGMPAAYVLAFPLGLSGVGLWSGLAFGLAVAALLLWSRFLRLVR